MVYNVSVKLFASGLARGAGGGGWATTLGAARRGRQNSIAEKCIDRFLEKIVKIWDKN